jgi:hypothetical protein
MIIDKNWVKFASNCINRFPRNITYTIPDPKNETARYNFINKHAEIIQDLFDNDNINKVFINKVRQSGFSYLCYFIMLRILEESSGQEKRSILHISNDDNSRAYHMRKMINVINLNSEERCLVLKEGSISVGPNSVDFISESNIKYAVNHDMVILDEFSLFRNFSRIYDYTSTNTKILAGSSGITLDQSIVHENLNPYIKNGNSYFNKLLLNSDDNFVCGDTSIKEFTVEDKIKGIGNYDFLVNNPNMLDNPDMLDIATHKQVLKIFQDNTKKNKDLLTSLRGLDQ